MKLTSTLTLPALFLSLVFVGCTSPDPATRPLQPLTPAREPELPSIQGAPVDLDFQTHLHYGNIEVETLEQGAKRITLRSENDGELHQSGIFWRLPEPLQPGDRFSLTLTARSLEGGTLAFPVMVESGEAPWAKAAIETLAFGPSPTSRVLTGEVSREAAQASTHIKLHLGELTGVLEIQSVELRREPALP